VESVEGTLRRLGEKDLLLQTSGNKVLRFRLIPRTEFLGKDGKPIRDSLLHPGDRITVEANPDDLETAVHVVLTRAGSNAERQEAAAPVDEARIGPPQESDFGRPHKVNDATAEDGAPGSSPGEVRPVSSASEDQAAGDRTPGGVRPESTGSAPRDESVDAIIADARTASQSFSSDLPNFAVQQVTTRYSGSRNSEKWRTMDVVTADVASVAGKEDYRNIRVNGKPTDRPEDSGSWSTGEFQLTLQDVLSPRSDATFTRRGDDQIRNRKAWVFDLSVDQPHSHLTVVDESGRRVKPAYRGTIWIDKETRRVLRIEQQAVNLPPDFGYDTQDSSLEYGFVDIDGKSYLVPANSVNQACGRGVSNCTRNVIQFRNYRKFSADSNITFQ